MTWHPDDFDNLPDYARCQNCRHWDVLMFRGWVCKGVCSNLNSKHTGQVTPSPDVCAQWQDLDDWE
jgi:hypothetical protein